MDDMIYRQAVLDMANTWTYNFCDPEDEWQAMKEIRDLPSAQPEIIRCRDCKWYEQPSHKIWENCVRWKDSNGILCPVKPDDFCSRAERRTDESD